MAILIIHPGQKTASWEKRIRKLEPEVEIRVWPDAGNPEAVEYVLAWNHPYGTLAAFPRLGCIASMGAGVDHILGDPKLPGDVPVTRVDDPTMAESMAHYVVAQVLNHCLRTRYYWRQQARGLWEQKIPRSVEAARVGILGLGRLGAVAADRLGRMGFRVAGWTRTERRIEGIETYAGRDGLSAFLRPLTVLVCMLPLTPHTAGILSRETFNGLQQGAFLVNVARGRHLVESDLLEALDTGRLSGACLDVFETEPLPEGHPFWSHPGITVTPHVSSLTNPATVVPQIVENYRRMKSGLPLRNVVDPRRGY